MLDNSIQKYLYIGVILVLSWVASDFLHNSKDKLLNSNKNKILIPILIILAFSFLIFTFRKYIDSSLNQVKRMNNSQGL